VEEGVALEDWWRFPRGEDSVGRNGAKERERGETGGERELQ